MAEPSRRRTTLKITAAAAPVSFSVLSPPEQGDAISGLCLAVAGLGPAMQPNLPQGHWPTELRPADAWAINLESESGWYVLLTQDCDVVRAADTEPTVSVAPLMLRDVEAWRDLIRNGYSSREWAYPSEKFTGIPDGKALVVDLAWTTSLLKGSLTAPGVSALRPLTGPTKADFAEWLAARAGRVPFPDDVVTKVLDPCFQARKAAAKKLDKAVAAGGTAPRDARVVGAVARWYARRDGMLIDFLGQVTGPLLQAAGWITADGSVDTEAFEKGRSALETSVLRKMNAVDPNSGYQIRITLADLAEVPASQFLKFALLLR